MTRERIKGVPPRLLVKTEQVGFFDTPTKKKTASDGRTGDLPLAFNESMALTESRTDKLQIIGTNIVIPESSFKTPVRQFEYDNAGLQTDSTMVPYRDSQQYAVDYIAASSGTVYDLLKNGSPVGNSGPGFQQPVWSKSKFEVDLPSTMTTPVKFQISQSVPPKQWVYGVTGSAGLSTSIPPQLASELTGSLSDSYPMLYYNFQKKSWEGIGKGWTLCSSYFPMNLGAFDPFSNAGYDGGHQYGTIGFSPSILNYFKGKDLYIIERRINELSGSLAGFPAWQNCFEDLYATAVTASNEAFAMTTFEEMMAAAQPIDDFGFPFSSKYHATSSQTLRLSNYIKRPFAVERIAVEFDNVEYTVYDTAFNMLGGSSTPYFMTITSSIAPFAINNFFVLNQRKHQAIDFNSIASQIYGSMYQGLFNLVVSALNTCALIFKKTLNEEWFENNYSEFYRLFRLFSGKLVNQLSLPLETTLTKNGPNIYVDTIREIITWGGVTSVANEATGSYQRKFCGIDDSYVDLYDFESAGLGRTALPHPWIRSLPITQLMLTKDKTQIKSSAVGTSAFNTISDRDAQIQYIMEVVPGLTKEQATFLLNPTSTTGGAGANALKATFQNVFSGSKWMEPLTQSQVPINAISREQMISTNLDLASNRLPALSFAQPIQMFLPSKNPSATPNFGATSFLIQPENPADNHAVLCTSTRASFELGGRNGLGGLRPMDRELNGGLRNANETLEQNLDYYGALFGNVVDGEMEENYYGGISGGDLIIGIFRPGAVALKKLSMLTTSSLEVYRNSFYSDTPYVLFPDDELVFGWQQPIPRDVAWCNWNSQSYYPSSLGSTKPQPGVVDISTILLGNAKVVFYGSEISLNEEYHDTLNQYLTNNMVSEFIGNLER